MARPRQQPGPRPRPGAESDEAAHDVLAAEAFAVPAADPTLEPAHDVLAADEFEIHAADPALGDRRVVLPQDPTGDPEPHDVLAAEEFPMPAGRAARAAAVVGAPATRWGAILRLVLAAAAVAVVRRVVHRRG